MQILGGNVFFDQNKNLDNLKYWSELKRKKLLKYVILAVTHVYSVDTFSFVFFTCFEDFIASGVPQGLRSIYSLPGMVYEMVFFKKLIFP